MKRLIKLLIFSLIFTGCSEKKINSETVSKKRLLENKKIIIKNSSTIVCIGDSITSGENSNTSWPKELRKIFNKANCNISIYNEGESGLSSSEFLNDSKYEFSKKSSLKKYPNIHYAFLLIGHNDTRKNSTEGRNRNNFGTPESYKKNMIRIIKFLKRKKNLDKRKTKVILIIPPPVKEPVLKSHWNFPNNFNFVMQKPHGYLSKLIEISKAMNIPLIDTHKVFNGGKSKFPQLIKAKDNLISPDTIHLSAKGQVTLANLIFTNLLIIK